MSLQCFAEAERPPDNPPKEKAMRNLNLLCLDGGGVRGLSTLYILQRIFMTKYGVPDSYPHQHFDMIGGTSTGGLIAIMLGRLEMSITQCIAEYIGLAGEVFRERKSRFPLNLKGQVKAKYDSEILKRIIKGVIVKQKMSEDELMLNRDLDWDYNCHTFVCATPKSVSADTTVLRSYRSTRGYSDLHRTLKIWEAARATSAATSYFDEIKVGSVQQEFLDGGFNANNPVDFLWDEAKHIFAPNERLEDRICCLISIGTGVDPVRDMGSKVWGLGKSLVKIATETEQTARRFQNVHDDVYRSGRYFRFNVDSLGFVGLDEAGKKGQIYQETDYYLRKPSVMLELERCAEALDGPFRFE